MKIYIVPMSIAGFNKHDIVVRLRHGEKPSLFMEKCVMALEGDPETAGSKGALLSLVGNVQEGQELQDGDVLLVRHSCGCAITNSIELNMEYKDGTYISENTLFSSIDMATKMEKEMCVCITDSSNKNIISAALQIRKKVGILYNEYPALKNIMIKDAEDKTQELSLLALITTQDDNFKRWAETLVLSVDSKYKSMLFPVAKQILETAKTDNGFSFLSKEEQVAGFLEFSKRSADTAEEIVPDDLIDFLKETPEYKKTREKLKEAGFGESRTQQFNVLQQVGYLAGRNGKTSYHKDVIYNLSDMGAGKTLMTVQAIYMIDCINIGVWNREPKHEFMDIEEICLPDKHIIAPALSVKASWVDTFQLFYDVEKDTDYHYVLKMEFDGVEAVSHLYIAPFTVRSNKVFVQETLPDPISSETYLIIDEIHQLVRRRISRTKFFVPKLIPVDRYRIFALSGTMSNLHAGEWLSLIRFLGDTDILNKPTDANKKVDQRKHTYKQEISAVAGDLETLQHRKFNVDDITADNEYEPVIKKKSVVDEDYFLTYGSKLLVPLYVPNDGLDVEAMFAHDRYDILVEPEEKDNVSFELFYRIAASSAITAESLQVAEELFGEQAVQHKSSIIKTISPFTDEEVMLLDTLHKIAADSGKYRSVIIARDINNAILNLNDGLQQKNLYTLIAKYAERNTRFFKYLSTLDVDVLQKLPKTSLIKTVSLEETHKFKVLKELLEKDKDETFLIVVNDYYAMKALADALGVEHLTKQELKDEMAYQELLDGLFEKQSVVIVTQDMIKSSLDLIQANRLIQYQLNTEVSDIIQTQNRINRIGQTRETRCYYIAADRLQNALIELFLDSYRNIRVAHKGIVELFADLSSQIDVINDYLDIAFKKLNSEAADTPEDNVPEAESENTQEQENKTDLMSIEPVPKDIQEKDGICKAILYPQKNGVAVIVPLNNGRPYTLGILKSELSGGIKNPVSTKWNLKDMKLAG